MSTSHRCAVAAGGGGQITGVLRCGGGGCVGLRTAPWLAVARGVGANALAGCWLSARASAGRVARASKSRGGGAPSEGSLLTWELVADGAST
eukprot:6568215-Pyramimonas_sp.AAC.1